LTQPTLGGVTLRLGGKWYHYNTMHFACRHWCGFTMVADLTMIASAAMCASHRLVFEWEDDEPVRVRMEDYHGR
jgi:hypothetical protein